MNRCVALHVQLALFQALDDVELRVKAILDRRRRMNCSGQTGEDVHFIRAAILESKNGGV